MTIYETLFVVHPEKGSRVKEFIDRFKKVIESKDGAVAQVDEWGARDLAYRIQKQGKGFYTLLRYRASGAAVDELERNLKLTDGILRYMTVRLEDDAPPINPSGARPHSEEPRHPPPDAQAKPEPSA